MLTPLYLFGGWSSWHSLALTSSPSFVLWFLVCSALVVVPTGLLEFRYFLPQTLLLLIHQPLYVHPIPKRLIAAGAGRRVAAGREREEAREREEHSHEESSREREKHSQLEKRAARAALPQPPASSAEEVEEGEAGSSWCGSMLLLPDVLALGFYCAVNLVTIYVFLFRPFYWPDGSVARFMW